MTQHEKKQRIFEKYKGKIEGFGVIYSKDDIPVWKHKNIKKKFCRDLSEKGILGYYDTSLFCNGIEGFLFAENYICYKLVFEEPMMVYYKNIRKIGGRNDSSNDNKERLYLRMMDGSVIDFNCCYFNKASLEAYIKEMMEFEIKKNGESDSATASDFVSYDEDGLQNDSVYWQMLEELIGLDEVKEQVGKITAFARMKKDMDDRGLDTMPISLNMAFVGNPGTAKTTVARIMAGILYEIGIISNNEIIEVGRADLVAQYVGHTADRVKKIFQKAKGKVLFIDEAYSLLEDNNGSFGDEAINTIVQEMENSRNDTVVIFAGYPDKMEELISRNPGLRSRIPFILRFEDYSAEDMVRITELEAKKRGFSISQNAKAKLRGICDQASGKSKLGNGRFCRNLTEKALLNYASRLYKNGNKTTGVGNFELTGEDFIIKPEKGRCTDNFGFGIN